MDKSITLPLAHARRVIIVSKLRTYKMNEISYNTPSLLTALETKHTF